MEFTDVFRYITVTTWVGLFGFGFGFCLFVIIFFYFFFCGGGGGGDCKCCMLEKRIPFFLSSLVDPTLRFSAEIT